VGTLETNLSRLESALRSIIEGSAARIFPENRMRQDLAGCLVESMRAEIQTRPGEDSLAPNLYILFVNPSRYKTLQGNQSLLDELAGVLNNAGQEAGLRFPNPPVVQVLPDPQVSPGKFNIIAKYSFEEIPQTSDVMLTDNGRSCPLTENAFLIVDGAQVVPITQAVVNIGRRPDNQVVIDDPQVSRLHAQLRYIKGSFIVFDLDSRGGTWVNGKRIRQQLLYPGDVIYLSNIPLVYGQESIHLDETQEYSPGSQGSE